MNNVRSFTSTSQLDGGKTFNDLPSLFAGSLEQCHDFCKTFTEHEWRKDQSIFGGYYAHEDGHCLIIT